MSSKHNCSGIILMVFIVLVTLLLIKVNFIHAQYYFSPVTPRCFIGPYLVTFNCSVPVSFGYSSVSNTKYKTSSNFKSIAYGRGVSNYYFQIDSSSGYSDGDYFTFIGTSPFTIAWAIQPAFTNVDNHVEFLDEIVPSNGFARLYSEELLDASLSQNIIYVGSSLADSSFTMSIAFTWEQADKPTYTTILVEENVMFPFNLNIPISAVEEGKVPVFIHMKCSSNDPCQVRLSFNKTVSNVGNGIVGIIFAVLGLCCCCGCCGIGCYFVARMRRVTPTNPAEKYQASIVIVGQQGYVPHIVQNIPMQSNYPQHARGMDNTQNVSVVLEPHSYYTPNNSDSVVYNSSMKD